MGLPTKARLAEANGGIANSGNPVLNSQPWLNPETVPKREKEPRQVRRKVGIIIAVCAGVVELFLGGVAMGFVLLSKRRPSSASESRELTPAEKTYAFTQLDDQYLTGVHSTWTHETPATGGKTMNSNGPWASPDRTKAAWIVAEEETKGSRNWKTVWVGAVDLATGKTVWEKNGADSFPQRPIKGCLPELWHDYIACGGLELININTGKPTKVPLEGIVAAPAVVGVSQDQLIVLDEEKQSFIAFETNLKEVWQSKPGKIKEDEWSFSNNYLVVQLEPQGRKKEIAIIESKTGKSVTALVSTNRNAEVLGVTALADGVAVAVEEGSKYGFLHKPDGTRLEEITKPGDDEFPKAMSGGACWNANSAGKLTMQQVKNRKPKTYCFLPLTEDNWGMWTQTADGQSVSQSDVKGTYLTEKFPVSIGQPIQARNRQKPNRSGHRDPGGRGTVASRFGGRSRVGNN